MIGGYWLWHLGERMTFEQAKREALAMAAIEYDTATVSGMDSLEAWDLVLPDSDDVDRIRHLPQGERVRFLSEDCRQFYQSSSLEERYVLAGGAPGGRTLNQQIKSLLLYH